jgi:NitT/TauT family transport system substrate-binding protein
MGGVLVAADSDIQSAADLAGRKVAVNTLNNINDTTVRASVRADGGDPSAVEFVELPFPDMGAALESGQVDAIQVVEPFLTLAQKNGARLVASNYVDAAPVLTIAAYFTTAELAQSDPDLVESFAAAMAKSAEYAEENPDAVREILTTYTQIDPAVIGDLTLPRFPTEVNRDSVETLIELGTQDGLFTTEPDLDALLP